LNTIKTGHPKHLHSIHHNTLH